MDFLDTDYETAVNIIKEEVASHKAYRFRLTLKLKVYNRVGADPDQIKKMVDELVKLEEAILEFEKELALLLEVEGAS